MNHKNKFILAAVLLALLLTAAVSGTLAYLADTTAEVKNVFTPASVPPVINETFTNNVKTDVIITNSGNISAYIRAAVVVTWQDSNGNVYGKAPVKDADYSISYGSAWTQVDGFWYYADPVVAGGKTSNLINECKPLLNCEDPSFTLHVEILTQTVQSEGMGATSAIDAFAKAEAVN